MELRQLRYLEAVARHRHFTHAAEELHVAQSALSHQIARLERELGVELLARTTRSVEPTQAGSLVVARARAILAEAGALREEVDELRGLVRGRVTVGALLFGGELDIPALLASFTNTYPEIDVGLREGTVQRMVDGLGDGSIDLAFVLEREPRDEFERAPLSSEELAVVMSPATRSPRTAEPAGRRARRRATDRVRARLVRAPAGRRDVRARRGEPADRARGERSCARPLTGRRGNRARDHAAHVRRAARPAGRPATSEAGAADDGRAVVAARAAPVTRRPRVRAVRPRPSYAASASGSSPGARASRTASAGAGRRRSSVSAASAPAIVNPDPTSNASE